VGVRGNKRADQLAGDAVKNGIEWHAPVQSSVFLPFSRVRLLEAGADWPLWQCGDCREAFVIYHTKWHKKRPLRNFEEFFV
jgi:hypothetical protein